IFIPFAFYTLNKQNELNKIFKPLIFPYFFIVFIMLALPGFGRFFNYLAIFLVVYSSNTIAYIYKSNLFMNKKLLVCCLLAFFPILYKSIYYNSEVIGGITGKKYKRVEGWWPYYTIFNPVDDIKGLDIHRGTLPKEE